MKYKNAPTPITMHKCKSNDVVVIYCKHRVRRENHVSAAVRFGDAGHFDACQTALADEDDRDRKEGTLAVASDGELKCSGAIL
jgi:hypothetical protein